MFARVNRNGTGPNARKYLQIVESYRQGGRVRQRVIATLGRLDNLQDTKTLAGVIGSLSRFCDQVRVVEASRSPHPRLHLVNLLLWKPPLVFSRLWEGQGLPEILDRLAFRAAGDRTPNKVTPIPDPPQPSPAELEFCSATKDHYAL